MPVVNRQTTTGKAKPPPPQSARFRVQPLQASTTGIKLCSYGRGKTGKTRLACSFPKPLLLIGTEDGTKSVANRPGIDFVRVAASADVTELVEMVANNGGSYWRGSTKLETPTGDPYKTVVLDTGGGLQDIILKEEKGLAEIPVQRTWGMVRREDWLAIGAQWKERIAAMMALADNLGKHVVVIAHERNFNEDQASDIMIPTVGAALSPSTANWLNGACDYVCQAFIREQITMVAPAGIKGADPEPVKTGRSEYCLRVGPHPVFMTGFRLPDGTPLPDVLVDPTYDKIRQLIAGQPMAVQPGKLSQKR